MDINSVIEYWIKSVEEDYKTAQSLFKDGRYQHSLFFCHLTIERALKALVLKNTGEHAPLTHQLIRLSELSGVNFSEEQKQALVEINTFNIKSRYDDYKLEFYKRATQEYAEKYFKEATNLYLWLKEQLSK